MTPQPMWADSHARRIALLCLALNLIILALIAIYQPVYLRDYRLNPNPDAVHFVLLGRNIFEHGVYSRNDAPPFVPDIMRPPGYPIFTGVSYQLLGTSGVYGFNVLCHIAMAVAVFWIGRPVFGERIAAFAGYLTALDMMLAVSNFTAMSEPLFCLAATIGVLLWLRYVLDPSTTRVSQLVSIGCVLGFATLTRPTSLYLPAVLVIASLGMTWSIRRPRPLVKTLLIALTSVLVVDPWVIRNHAVFGIARITHTDVANLVHWSGATAHSIHWGIPIEEAQEEVRKEFGLVSLRETNNHWRADRPVRTMYLEQAHAAKQILFRYPLALAQSSLLGIGKASVAHNVRELATMCGHDWHSIHFGSAITGNLSPMRTALRRNAPALMAIVTWQLVFQALVLPLGFVGMLRGLWAPNFRIAVLCLCMIVGYYWLTIAVVGAEAYYRHRAMVMPLWCLFAAMALFPSRSDQSTSDSESSVYG